jgi:hypothetical protein
MVSELIKQFEKINGLYEVMIALTEESFQALKTKKLDKRSELQMQEERTHKEMAICFQELKQLVVALCEQKGCEEHRIHSLLPHLSVEEKEQVMACQKTAFHLDAKLQNNLKSTLCLTRAMMEVNQQEVEAAVYLIGKQTPPGGGNGVLVNRRL